MTKDLMMRLTAMLIGGIGYAFLFNYSWSLAIGVFCIHWANKIEGRLEQK